MNRKKVYLSLLLVFYVFVAFLYFGNKQYESSTNKPKSRSKPPSTTRSKPMPKKDYVVPKGISTKEGYLACLTGNLFYEATGYMKKDKKAFIKVIEAEDCLLWKEGVEVEVINNHPCSPDDCLYKDMIIVRPIGERIHLWTTKAAIN